MLLVTAPMLRAVSGHATATVEVVVSDGARAEGLAGMAFAPLDRAAAMGVPGTRAHREIADRLTDAIAPLL